MDVKIKNRRNQLPLPRIQYEERLASPMELPGFEEDWAEHVNKYERLYLHQTLSSTRKSYRCKAPLAPKDLLDYRLESAFVHGSILFPDKTDVCRQFETLGVPTWRLLKNTQQSELSKRQKEFIKKLQNGSVMRPKRPPPTDYDIPENHPLRHICKFRRRVAAAKRSTNDPEA